MITLALLGSEWDHGSASQIKTFSLCQLKWYLDKIAQLPRPPAHPAAVLGSVIHKQIEDYLTDGTPPEDPRAVVSLRLLPPGGSVPRDQVEREIRIPTRPGVPPLWGFIDLFIPGEVPEIIDHKTMGSWRFAKTPESLPHDPQMVIYARYALEQFPNAPRIRVTHHQIKTKGPPEARRVSVTITPEEIRERFDRLVDTVEDMAQCANKTAAEVPANLNACGAFGGCPYLDKCPKRGGASAFAAFDKPKPQTKDQKMNEKRTLAEILAHKNKPPGGSILPPEAPTREQPKPPGGLFLTAPTKQPPAPSSPTSETLPASSKLSKKDLQDAAEVVRQGMEADGVTVIDAAQFRADLCVLWNKKRLRSGYLNAVAKAAADLFTWDGSKLRRVYYEQDPAIAAGESRPGPNYEPDPVLDIPQPPAESLRLFVDCLPEKGIHGVTLAEALAPLISQIADAVGSDPLLVPYNEGTKKVAALLRVAPISGAVFVDSRDPYWAAASSFLRSQAAQIVRGVR